MVTNQHFSLDEIRSALAEWNDMGAVEQMREDANGWVVYVGSLVEQLDTVRELNRRAEERCADAFMEARGLKEQLEEAHIWKVTAEENGADYRRLKEQLEAVNNQLDVEQADYSRLKEQLDTVRELNRRAEERCADAFMEARGLKEQYEDAESLSADRLARVRELEEQLETLRLVLREVKAAPTRRDQDTIIDAALGGRGMRDSVRSKNTVRDVSISEADINAVGRASAGQIGRSEKAALKRISEFWHENEATEQVLEVSSPAKRPT